MDLNSFIKVTFKKILEMQIFKWDYFEIDIEYAPFPHFGGKKFINRFFYKGEKFPEYFVDINYPLDLDIWYCIYLSNITGNPFNRIIYKAEKSNLDNADCQLIFDQAIVDRYNDFLPKSKRGKIIPWWNIPEQVEKLKAKRTENGLENFEI